MSKKKLATFFGFFLFFHPLVKAFSAADQHSSCPEFPFLSPNTGPLAVLNCDMHKAYEQRLSQILNTFGAVGGRPIILNLGGSLVLKYNGQAETIQITTDDFHAIKSFCHEALTIFLILTMQNEGALDQAMRAALEKSYAGFTAAQAEVRTFPPNVAAVLGRLVSLSKKYIEKVLRANYWDDNGLKVFYTEADKSVQKLLYLSAKMEIASLDKAIKPWLAKVPAVDKQKIGIVVATVHQARAQEISVQYFAKIFKKRFGVGAIGEDGMIVVENGFSQESALKMLARHYLDRELGQTVFGDPESMQQDLLGKSAKKILGL